jgi:hypothetical protein
MNLSFFHTLLLAVTVLRGVQTIQNTSYYVFLIEGEIL